ncbi:hypothetical protein LZF95_00475 [Algoriphagus sp. AGSA1]|uniref:hypothetical protein n=1 Tax=Algoriphagus sp. AGSA1 TaxID=2907213 RepID=UPI001F2D9DA3|nr:hypothetical protein [Algoriphagus sp. AGSA1]MCE7053128.1 hypothetical protein [Algoriphagus sp. AGSA1]
MSILVLNISNLNNPSFNAAPHYQQENISRLCGLLTKSLEINRRIITGISSEWESDEELFGELQKLFNQHQSLEAQAYDLLNP